MGQVARGIKESQAVHHLPAAGAAKHNTPAGKGRARAEHNMEHET